MEKVWIIGIAGGTASGKTTIVNKLKKLFENDVELISHDSYYKAHYDMTYDERAQLNYDHPDSFETERMINQRYSCKSRVRGNKIELTFRNKKELEVFINSLK